MPFSHSFSWVVRLDCDGSFPRTRAPVPATGSGEPLGTDAEPGPSLSDGVRGPSHRFPECGMGNSECGMRNAEEIRIELISNSAFRIPHFFRCLRFSSSYDLGVTQSKRKKPVPEGPAQTMALPQTVAAFRVQALERSRFAVGRLPAAYGDWSARPLACRSEGNGVRWVWKCLAELTTRLVSALRPSIAVARGDRATVRTRDFPSSPPMGDSFWLGL